MPEQRTIDVRDPSQLPKAPIPEMLPPRTVSDPQPNLPEQNLSLDEAIRIALSNSQVVRVRRRSQRGLKRTNYLRLGHFQHAH